MADVRVRITRLLAEIASTERITRVQADTAAEAVEALCSAVPALRVHVFDDAGTVRQHVNVFVRGDLMPPDGLDVSIDDGDEVTVMQAVSGGGAASPGSPGSS